MKNSVSPITAMAFHHADGLVPAWKQAIQFAGKSGHIATMLDIVDARIATGINDHPWNNYYTTTSAEYFGYSRGGVRILIVTHGIGPISTIEGIQKAYSHEYKDKTRNNRGGRISVREFQDLESGKYGDVHIVEFDSIVERYRYPFMGYLTVDEAIEDPLLQARLGSRAEEYLNHHAHMAIVIHQDEHKKIILDPYIVEMGATLNCPYTVGGWRGAPRQYPFLDKGDGAVAHLLSTGRLSDISHEREERVPHSIANNIDCHEWSNSVRFVAIRDNITITDIHPGVSNVQELILKNWTSLMEKIPGPTYPGGFYTIMSGESNTLFTQYPKKGTQMDTYKPEFRITAIKTVGALMQFKTTISGYQGLFRYDIKRIQALSPLDANAYAIIGNPTTIWEDGNPTHHRAYIQFYRVVVDTSQRLIQADNLRNNYDKLMSLIDK